ncbi:unnamed protein product [Gordionus sp. m RMFG-2023]
MSRSTKNNGADYGLGMRDINPYGQNRTTAMNMSNNKDTDRSSNPQENYYVPKPDQIIYNQDEEEEEDEDEEEEESEEEEEESEDDREHRFNGSGNPYSNPTTTIVQEESKVDRRSFSSPPMNTTVAQKQSYYSGAHRKSRVEVMKDCFDSWFTNVNSDLLICKAFYFFFFSAFGSLYPMLGVYLKQLGFNPKQTGLVMGFRPFVELCSAPLWSSLAEKYQRAKHILLFSLVCWIIFTLSVAFVTPKPAGCVIFNETHRFFEPPLQHTFAEDQKAVKLNQGSESLKPVPGGTSAKLKRRSVYFVNTNLTFFSGNPKFFMGDIPIKSESMQPSSKTLGDNRLILFRVKRDISLKDFFDIKRKGHKLPKGYILGKSPIIISRDWLENYPENIKTLVKPTFSNVLYDEKEVQRTFLINLMLMVVGEFFAAPSLPIADSATLGYLGTSSNNYGKQRMFGSLGWGLAMFFIGVALDQSTSFPTHPCGDHDPGEKNYTICFAVFSVLMSLAFIAASQFYFKYQTEDDFIQMRELEEESRGSSEFYKSGGRKQIEALKAYVPGTTKFSGSDRFDDDFSESYNNDPIIKGSVENKNFNFQMIEKKAPPPLPLPPRPPTLNIKEFKGKKDKTKLDKERLFRQNELKADAPSWIKALKAFKTPYHITFLFIAFYMGLGMGFVFTFLFWHLQDIGGSPTIFGMASVINHMSELLTYLFSARMMNQLGHIKILYFGLIGNSIRFLYISWLRNPWWVLPFEFIQGLTHAAVWIACSSFVSHTVPIELKSSAQSLLQALHHGLGRGCGAALGGVLIQSYGSKIIFRAYGGISILLLIIFYVMNKYFAKSQPFPDISQDLLFEEHVHLDPHGLPLNTNLSRDVSRNLLSDLQDGNESLHKDPHLSDLTNYNINRLTPIYKSINMHYII